MDFETVCKNFQRKEPAAFIADVRDFIAGSFNTIANSDEPAMCEEDIAHSLRVLHEFERVTLANPELYINWLVFALFNCRNVPRCFLAQDDIQNKNAMTPLTSALLPMPTVLRAPHFDALKQQIAEYFAQK